MRQNSPTQVSVQATRSGALQRLALYLIKPSRYDDDGFVVRHFRGVIPSNTLATLHGLTQDAAHGPELQDFDVATQLVDEAVEKIPYDCIRRDAARWDTRVVIALCGVQSNQFPRAADLALRFRRQGLTVLMGGFHVSGANALVPGIAPELRAVADAGAHLVRGEVDACWGGLLRQAIDGTLPPVLDLMDARPDLYDKPIPLSDGRYRSRFALPGAGTVDAGRGCPFGCSFCTIINVQGRRMRYRSAERVLEAMRRQYALGTTTYFFTDDNFARHPEWAQVFDGMVRLREEGLKLHFMMQVDTLAAKIPGFVEKARAAGCVQVFIGMESLNAENLKHVNKRQNKVSDFQQMIAAWQNAGVTTHCGYILGFPFDTPESIADDVRRLRDEVQADLVSFFILTPLPGSADHAEAVIGEEAMDPDLNSFDSFHVVTEHPRMTRAQLQRAYRDAWHTFYTPEHMKRCLARKSGSSYASLFNALVWQRHAIRLGEHPMVSGFWRLKDLREHRPTLPRPTRLLHACRRAADFVHYADCFVRVFLEMQDVWLATRRPLPEEGRIKSVLKSAVTLRPASLLCHLSALLHRGRRTRADLTEFWRNLLGVRWWRANPLAAPLKLLQEATLHLQFLLRLPNLGTELVSAQEQKKMRKAP